MENGDVKGPRVQQMAQLREEDKRVLNRVQRDRTHPYPKTPEKLDLSPLGAVFRRSVQDITDVRNIFRTIPELILNKDILVSAIVAPGDLTTTNLNIQGKVKGVEQALTVMFDDRLTTHFIDENHLQSKVPDWIEDAYIMTGHHAILLLPEAALDRMMMTGDTSSLEAIEKFDGEFVDGWFAPKGLLGIPALGTVDKPEYVSLESAKRTLGNKSMTQYHTIKVVGGTEAERKVINSNVRVTDNLAALRMPAVHQIHRNRLIEKSLGASSLEARRQNRHRSKAKNAEENATVEQVYSKFFKSPSAIGKSRLVIVPSGRQLKDKSEGHPIEYHLAGGSVMPAYISGNVEEHVGYWLFLDAQGYPISFNRQLDYYEDIRKGSIGGDNTGSAGQFAGELLNMSKEAITGGISNATNDQIDRVAELNGQIVEMDLIARLQASMGGEFEIGRTDHHNRMLFARHCRNQFTTVLFVPADLMIYMAYDYNEFGIGKSILEDAKTAAAIHSVLTVADTIGSVRAAIPGKEITINIDPNDKDPLGTATWMANEALGIAYRRFPMNVSTPMGAAEELQLSAISINVKGSDLFPSIETTAGSKETNYTPIDPATIERSRDNLTRIFSQTPEMIGSMNNPDFATTILQNNHMLLQRVVMVQNKTHPFLADYVRVFTTHSGPLIDALLDIIEENQKLVPKEYKDEPERLIEAYLDSLSVTLPSPEVDNLSKQLEIFEKYSTSLDSVIAAYIREEYFDGYEPDLYREAIPSAIAAFKGKLQRDWMRKRGILRELDIFGKGENGKALLDLGEEMTNHVDGLKGALGGFLEKAMTDAINRKERQRTERLTKLREEAEAAKTPAPAEPEGGGELNADGTAVDGALTNDFSTDQPQAEVDSSGIDTFADDGNQPTEGLGDGVGENVDGATDTSTDATDAVADENTDGTTDSASADATADVTADATVDEAVDTANADEPADNVDETTAGEATDGEAPVEEPTTTEEETTDGVSEVDETTDVTEETPPVEEEEESEETEEEDSTKKKKKADEDDSSDDEDTPIKF